MSRHSKYMVTCDLCAETIAQVTNIPMADALAALTEIAGGRGARISTDRKSDYCKPCLTEIAAAQDPRDPGPR